MTSGGFALKDPSPELLAAAAAKAAPVVTLPGVPGVYACIVKVSADLAKEGVGKDGRNVQQGYAFRGIEAVMNALAPILVKHGLVILPRCLSRDVVERQTKNGGALFYVTVEAQFDFVCAADGSTHPVRMYGEAMDSADKATNKAMSAAYKYAACQTFCIPTEGEDADATTPDEVLPTPGRDASPPARDAAYRPSAGNGGDSQHSNPAPAPPQTAILPHREERKNTAEPPVGDRGSLILKVEEATIASGKRKGEPKWFVHFETGSKASTIDAKVADEARRLKADGVRIHPRTRHTDWGDDLLALHGGETDASF